MASLCICLSQALATDSLVQLCGVIEAETGICMSAEGLNQRLNSKAVEVSRQIFASLLSSKLNNSISNCIFDRGLFKRIRLMDSTSFQLPDSFEDIYPGCGGSSNTDGV